MRHTWSSKSAPGAGSLLRSVVEVGPGRGSNDGGGAWCGMRDRWLSFCGSIGAEGPARALYETIEALYAHPRRMYHNLDHIRECLDIMDEVGSADEPVGLELAIWLHDCIYEPGRPDNEPLSAEVAIMFGHELGLSDDLVKRVQALILATRHSAPPGPGQGDDDLIADIDLAILAAEPENYDRYAAAIRVEFGFAPDEQYRKGREGFLRSLLARERIYQTDHFRVRAESRARGNIEREILGLEMK